MDEMNTTTRLGLIPKLVTRIRLPSPALVKKSMKAEVIMSEANKELVRRHFEEIFNRQNLDPCDEIMADDYVEHAVAPLDESAPGRVSGPRTMRGTAEWLLAQFPDLHMTIEALVAEADTVAVRILSEGTNLGEFNGMPPTGKRPFRLGRATGIESKTASWPSIGRPGRIFSC